MLTSKSTRIVITAMLAMSVLAAGTTAEARESSHDRPSDDPLSSPPLSALSGERTHQDCQRPTRTPVPAGIRGKIVSGAVRLLAKMIRNGGEYVGKVLRYLDDDAARAFRRHSKDISKELDRIAKLPDLTTEVVKEQLFNFLKNTVGLSGGTALEIADAVKAVLDWVVF